MMKKPYVLAALALVAVPVWAQQVSGRVISAIPVRQQVAVPQTECVVETRVQAQPNTGAGAALGAVVGGVAGYNVAHRYDRGGAAAAGAVVGALIGNSIESQNAVQQYDVQNCYETTVWQDQLAYEVIYEYGGRNYSARVNSPPGEYIALQVTSSGVVPVQMVAAPAPVYSEVRQQAQPVVLARTASPVIVAPVVAYPPVYYGYGYAAPVALSVGYYGGGARYWYGGGWGHRPPHYRPAPPPRRPVHWGGGRPPPPVAVSPGGGHRPPGGGYGGRPSRPPRR